MNAFSNLLHADGEFLLQAVYRAASKQSFKLFGRVRVLAASMGLNEEQFVCGLGFNPRVHDYTDILSSLGYADFSALQVARDAAFCADVYERLSLENVTDLYAVVKLNAPQLQELQPLLLRRIQTIEATLEANIRPRYMHFYRTELESVYRDGIATIEFAEARLAIPDNGFRSMLNEVLLIANARLIPAGDIFFRDGVFPQEKRRLIDRGLVPKLLIRARLKDPNLTREERSVLEASLANALDGTDD